jgi:hypothetical protein
VQKNIVPNLSHNIRLLQFLIREQHEFHQDICQDNSTAISLLQMLDHNMHTLNESQDIILAHPDSLTAQNETFSAQNHAIV